MATINPVRTAPAYSSESVLWETLTEVDDAAAITPSGSGPIAMAVQFTGSFGGATVVLQGTCDGTNWVTITDTFGNLVSFTATGAAEISSSMTSFRPSASGGSSQDIDTTLVIRGGA